MQTITFNIGKIKKVKYVVGAFKENRRINEIMTDVCDPLPIYFYGFGNGRGGSLSNALGDALIDYGIRTIGKEMAS